MQQHNQHVMQTSFPLKDVNCLQTSFMLTLKSEPFYKIKVLLIESTLQFQSVLLFRLFSVTSAETKLKVRYNMT